MPILLLTAALLAFLVSPAAAQRARDRATAPDTSFGALITRLSEPEGYFDTDNLISNEASYLHVAGRLRESGVRGGAYLGVGPDQNFSYIAHLRPDVAILVDIRRDNLLQHLLFKALFTVAGDRAHYLGLLTARPVAAAAPAEDIESIVARVDGAAVSPQAFDSVHALVADRVRAFGIALTAGDLATIRRIHGDFARHGLDLRFQSHGRPPMPYYPTLRQLILERDLEGRRSSYLASDEDFAFVRSLQLRNRVVPVVGDLAGDVALPAIARFLAEQDETVSAVYTSNVEYYLAREGRLSDFLDNLRALPQDGGGLVIRSVFRFAHPETVPGYGSTQLLQLLSTLLEAYARGQIRSYADLVTVGSMKLR